MRFLVQQGGIKQPCQGPCLPGSSTRYLFQACRGPLEVRRGAADFRCAGTASCVRRRSVSWPPSGTSVPVAADFAVAICQFLPASAVRQDLARPSSSSPRRLRSGSSRCLMAASASSRCFRAAFRRTEAAAGLEAEH